MTQEPMKCLVKADEARKEAFVAEYAVLREEAQRTEARIFFADEAHLRADAELRGKWALREEPALVDFSNPRRGEKASYYWTVCLETRDVEWMELEGNSNAETSAAFLSRLRQRHTGPLNVPWDNAPAHRGPAMRSIPRDPRPEPGAGESAGLQPRLQRRRRHLGLGKRGGDGQPVLGEQGQGAREGRQIPERTGQPEGRGATPLPHDLAIQGRSTPARLPARFPAQPKCTSHLGFGLAF